MSGQWIFLRGLTRESRHWGDFPQQFSARLPSVRIHLPDLPGNGMRCAERSPDRVAAMVEDCRKQLARAGIAPPFFVLGLSMGGMLAAAWASMHPAELRGCVLLNSSIAGLSPFYQRLAWRSWPRLFRLGCAAGKAGIQEQLIWRLTSARPPCRRTIEGWTALRLGQPVSAANALRQLLASSRFRLAAPPAVPLLILASRGDCLVDPACSRRLAAAWGAAFALHPDAGHDLALDDGPWVADQVQAWMDTCMAGGQAACDAATGKRVIQPAND